MHENRLGEHVYLRLKEMILSLHVKPGERLVDRDLASELNVSRTPVVSALNRLERDGLIVSRGKKGYFVLELDAKQAADLYDVREMLEVYAVRLATQAASPQDVQELQDVLTTLDNYAQDPAKRSDEIKAGLRVHSLIARASGNAFLHQTLVRLLDRMWPLIWIEVLYEDAEAAELTRREHSALLSLIRDKRADDAEAVIRRHIQTAKEHITRILKAREDFYQQTGPSPDGFQDQTARNVPTVADVSRRTSRNVRQPVTPRKRGRA